MTIKIEKRDKKLNTQFKKLQSNEQRQSDAINELKLKVDELRREIKRLSVEQQWKVQ